MSIFSSLIIFFKSRADFSIFKGFLFCKGEVTITLKPFLLSSFASSTTCVSAPPIFNCINDKRIFAPFSKVLTCSFIHTYFYYIILCIKFQSLFLSATYILCYSNIHKISDIYQKVFYKLFAI